MSALLAAVLAWAFVAALATVTGVALLALLVRLIWAVVRAAADHRTRPAVPPDTEHLDDPVPARSGRSR